MKRTAFLSLVFGWMFAVVHMLAAAEPQTEQGRAIAEITKIGGTVTIDEKKPDRPVVKVLLPSALVDDALLERLKGLKQLESLELQ